MRLMITKSGVFVFHAPNIIVCGSMDSGRRMPVPEIQELSCSHKVRVILHETFVQSTLFNLNKLFKDLCAVGSITMFFRSI